MFVGGAGGEGSIQDKGLYKGIGNSSGRGASKDRYGTVVVRTRFGGGWAEKPCLEWMSIIVPVPFIENISITISIGTKVFGQRSVIAASSHVGATQASLSFPVHEDDGEIDEDENEDWERYSRREDGGSIEGNDRCRNSCSSMTT